MKETNIADIDRYNTLMSQSIFDKLWFVSHIEDVSIIVDFGCANGTLIEYLANILPHTVKLVGYDVNEEMLQLAHRKCATKPNTVFTSNWDVVKTMLDKNNEGNSCLILSSVIHEVYYYAQFDSEIDEFWNRVFKTGFDFIAARDMLPCMGFKAQLYTALLKNDIQYGQIYQQAIEKNHKDNPALLEYKKAHGFETTQPIPEKWLLDYLLHYHFYGSDNWANEVNEIYTLNDGCFTITSIADCDTDHLYNVDLNVTYRLPYLYRKWKRELGIDYCHDTHYKILFSKKDSNFNKV